jgi:phosphoenolpyruvate carboxylase
LIEQLSDLNLHKHTNGIPNDCIFTPESKEQLETFKLIATLPCDSLNTYIISMASEPSDVLLVFFLQKALGVTQPLKIVPLFETLADLKNAANCIDALLSIDVYKKTCNGLQEILIGYSDSAKDAGFLAASWAQYQAQEALMAVGERHNIRIVFFHGRGGSTGRGGGPTHLAIRSQPPGSVQGRLRITQQGEMIRHRFGMQKIAERTLGIYATATLEAMLLPEPLPTTAYREMMNNASQISLKIYQHNIKENPRFMNYFYAVTPINELDKLAIASRPTRRKSTGGIDNLRAIPWVFAWTQNRLLLPAWLGVGEALEAICLSKNDIVNIGKNWLFFSSLLNMIEIVLAKSAPHITQQYEQRLVSEDLWDLGAEYRTAFLKTKHYLLKILEQSKLLSNNPILERSIQVRSPYLLALHLLQIELLDRYRNSQRLGDINTDVEQALLVSIEGIAAGMHNTG